MIYLFKHVVTGEKKVIRAENAEELLSKTMDELKNQKNWVLVMASK